LIVGLQRLELAPVPVPATSSSAIFAAVVSDRVKYVYTEAHAGKTAQIELLIANLQ